MPATAKFEALALPGLPMVKAGDDLAALLADALARCGEALRAGDVVVVAQKIVSKAEDRRVVLDDVVPSARALQIADETAKDPRLVELILSESRRVVRKAPGVLIVEHRLGFVMANAGIDQSNVGADDEPAAALLLPLDPDGSAERLRAGLGRLCGALPGIVINDSFGRPWRQGTMGIAIGAAGIPALLDKRGKTDLFGRPLKVTVIGLADEIAAAASLLMGGADEGQPVVILRGLDLGGEALPASALVRPAEEDLFR